MKYIFLILVFLNFNSWSAEDSVKFPKDVMTLNQILFSESAQSWSARDFNLFQKVKFEIVAQKKMSQFSENEAEDFLLSRLAAREALLFKVTPIKLKLSEVQKKSLLSEYSVAEIESELTEISLSQALIELKETQLKQKLRFKTWFDLLKRKYQVKIKSADFKI
jgi:hypothetical protein